MQTVSLTWQHSAELAGVLAVASGGLRAVPQRHIRKLAPLVFEASILAILYAMWQLAGKLSVIGTAGALQRAEWIRHFDDDLPLPSEQTLNHLLVHQPLLTQGANLYYAAMHFTTMFAFLLWLFVRHRDHYRPVRATMAWTTFVCLLIQLIPVAPPRMLPGFIDTGDLYNQSVYNHGLAVDQLSAMPSVHVAWAFVVGYYVWTISASRWRFVGPMHAVLTTLFVVATANHWWLDGIVGVAVLIGCAWARFGTSTAVHRLLDRRRASVFEPVPSPATAPALP